MTLRDRLEVMTYSKLSQTAGVKNSYDRNEKEGELPNIERLLDRRRRRAELKRSFKRSKSHWLITQGFIENYHC